MIAQYSSKFASQMSSSYLLTKLSKPTIISNRTIPSPTSSFFLEHNMLRFFLDIMKQNCGNYVTVQLLQTLNILFENIRHETSLYYLLSNNHVNSIIMHKFDFSDEEVMAYYISFLKTLSFKLNPHTIHFFFNTSDFPLYMEAVKYFNHPEKMVRIAVRILTLNVFKVDEKAMLAFITGQSAPCLFDLVHFIRDSVSSIEKCLKEPSSQLSAQSLEDTFAEHLDYLHYLNDVLMLKIEAINRILSDNLMHHLVKPLVDAYKDDPRNSMIRLFTLEFTTSILSKVLSSGLYDEESHDHDGVGQNGIIGKVASDDNGRDRLANEVEGCNTKQDLTSHKLSSSQLAIIEQSKEIAEIKVKTLLKTDTRQQMTYLSLFDVEYNDMKRKRLSTDYLLMDTPHGSSSSSSLSSGSLSLKSDTAQECTGSQKNKTPSSIKAKQTTNDSVGNKSDSNQDLQTKFELDRARYQIRDFLLWRQLLLNIKNEKDRELSLKNTSWLSYAKLLQWLE